MAKTFYVYLLASGPCGYLYVGVTNDIVRRVADGRVHATTTRAEPDPDSSTTADPSDPEEHDEQAG